jgi:hypothetical protein
MVKGTRLIANMNEQKVDATTYKKNGWQTNIFGVLSHFSFLVLVMSRFLVEP